jgi:hypothetical protein
MLSDTWDNSKNIAVHSGLANPLTRGSLAIRLRMPYHKTTEPRYKYVIITLTLA